MNYTFIGAGYVGLVNAVLMASFNHDVICYDINKEKIALLKQGIATIEEPNLQTLLTEAKSRLRFTTNAKDAIRPNKIIVICVDTPEGANGEPNMSHYYEALDAIAANAIQDCYVVIRSTVPVGTNRLTKQYLEQRSEYKFNIVSMPEFMSQGRAINDLVNPNRVVIGAADEESALFVRVCIPDFLQKKIPVLLTTPENAELIKYASNSFLAMKVSYINNIARLCEKVGADVDKVALGMSLDPRIGSSFLKAGVGFGGSCFPKDTNGLYWLSNDQSVPMELVKTTISINEDQIEFFLNKIRRKYRTFNNLTIAVLGLSFKGGTEDTRNSPAIPIVKEFLSKNAYVQVYDPLAEDNFQLTFSRHTHIKYCDYPHDALKGADFVVILTDSPEFKELTAADYISSLKNPVIFDGRNIYKLDDMVGTDYYSVGRPDVVRNKK